MINKGFIYPSYHKVIHRQRFDISGLIWWFGIVIHRFIHKLSTDKSYCKKYDLSWSGGKWSEMEY
jgi:hypothetical protein